MDACSRKIIGQFLWCRMRKEQVKWWHSRIIKKHPVKVITLRNHNGTQFVSQLVRVYLKEMQVYQEFTHIATPEENAFIDSCHSILERTIERRYEFESIYDTGIVINRWKRHYNEKRLHGGLGDKSPQQTWDVYYAGVDLFRQLEAAKPYEKSRSVVKFPCEMASTARYSLVFSGWEISLPKVEE